MIYFCHNCCASEGNNLRLQTLTDTVTKEYQAYPDSEWVLHINGDPIPSDVAFCIQKMHDNGIPKDRLQWNIHTKYDTHKLGCYNAFFFLLEQVRRRNPSGDDRIVFSHDDVYLADDSMFRDAMRMVDGETFFGYFRQFIEPGKTKQQMNDAPYIMIESCILHPMMLQFMSDFTRIDDEDFLIKDFRGSSSPELNIGNWLTTIKKNMCRNINYAIYTIEKNNYGLNSMGYFHIDFKRGEGWQK